MTHKMIIQIIADIWTLIPIFYLCFGNIIEAYFKKKAKAKNECFYNVPYLGFFSNLWLGITVFVCLCICFIKPT